MTIEIHKPEPEALIRQRMQLGGFRSIEDFIIQALQLSPAIASELPEPEKKTRTGADLIAALQSSPYREIEIEPERSPMPVREVAFWWRGFSTQTSCAKCAD